MSKISEKIIKSETAHWYAVHTYSGYEDAVARYLKQRIESLGMSDKIFNIIIPKEKKIRIKDGKRVMIEEKIYPGYVLVEMIMGPDTWYVVRNTPRVAGFVGVDTTTPASLSKEDVDFLMARMTKDASSFKIDIKLGDLVRITDGPFKEAEGKIAEIDETRARVKVMVSIFGRDTSVELDVLQVKKF